MNTQQLQLVTFEQAKRLKQLGFNWEINGYYSEYYDNSGKLIDWNLQNYNRMVRYRDGYFSAPTVALALKWMRDVKGINNAVNFFDVVTPKYEGCYQVPRITDVGERRLQPRTHYSVLTSKYYEAAESALLDELLTILEKEV